MSVDVKIVTGWDQMPANVEADGQIFSTRVLEKRYRDMVSVLEIVAGMSPDDPIDAEMCKNKAIEVLKF